jgi:hypothetical protein
MMRAAKSRQRLKTLAPGLTARAVLEKLATMQMIDVELQPRLSTARRSKSQSPFRKFWTANAFDVRQGAKAPDLGFDTRPGAER